MNEEPLFSKKLDELLPPELAASKKASERGFRSRPTNRYTFVSDDKPARQWELNWWQSGLCGGIAVVLITSIRAIRHIVFQGVDGIDWDEIAMVGLLAFGVGVSLGLAFWGFEWLKVRFKSSKG